MRKPVLACLLMLTSCLAAPCLTATAQTTTEYKGHTGLVFDVAVSPDGSTLATASFDNTIKLWDIKTGKEKATLKGHTQPVYCVAFSPDGNLIASSGADNTIKIWDKEGKMLRELKGHSDLVQAVAFAPDRDVKRRPRARRQRLRRGQQDFPKAGQERRSPCDHRIA